MSSLSNGNNFFFQFLTTGELNEAMPMLSSVLGNQVLRDLKESIVAVESVSATIASGAKVGWMLDGNDISVSVIVGLYHEPKPGAEVIPGGSFTFSLEEFGIADDHPDALPTTKDGILEQAEVFQSHGESGTMLIAFIEKVALHYDRISYIVEDGDKYFFLADSTRNNHPMLIIADEEAVVH